MIIIFYLYFVGDNHQSLYYDYDILLKTVDLTLCIKFVNLYKELVAIEYGVLIYKTNIDQPFLLSRTQSILSEFQNFAAHRAIICIRLQNDRQCQQKF